jgi:AraC-like DNA-binding protein
MASQLLADTTLSFGQVAAVLDASEASTFTRAFRRWSGQPPKAWRAAHRPGTGPALAQTVKTLSPPIKRRAFGRVE